MVVDQAVADRQARAARKLETVRPITPAPTKSTVRGRSPGCSVSTASAAEAAVRAALICEASRQAKG